MTVKRWHFAAAAQYRKSCDDLGANRCVKNLGNLLRRAPILTLPIARRYGDELGRLKVGEGHVKRAMDSSKRGVAQSVLDDLKSLQQIIAANLARGSRDNDLIYLEPITPASNLPPIAPAVMAKAVLPAELANPIPLLRETPAPALGKPLFAELVPYGVHLAISIYEDRKDSLVREEISARREELDAISAR